MLTRFSFVPALLAALLITPAPPAASAQSASLTTADCAASAFELDCACVMGRFNEAASGIPARHHPAAARMARTLLGIPGQGAATEDAAIYMELMPVIHALMDVGQTCKSKGGGADPLSLDVRQEVRDLCERSRHIVDCDCVGFHYAKAANGLPPSGQDFARAQLGVQLDMPTSPALEDIPMPIMMQHASVMDALGDTARQCATPTASAMAAWRNASHAPSVAAPTLQARANASANESLLLWCMTDGSSAAECACKEQVIRDLMPERAYRFRGESMKAQALVELGQLQGPQRFEHAARAMGHAKPDVKALHAESDIHSSGVLVIANNVCSAVSNEFTPGD